MPSDALAPPLKPPSPRVSPRLLGNPYYRRSLRPILFITVSCFLVYLFYSEAQFPQRTIPGASDSISDRIDSFFRASLLHNNTLYQKGTEDRVAKDFDYATNPCRDFPNTDGILLVLKTGATEVFDKLPTQLITNLQCLPDFLVFSDREQQLGRWHIHDALEGVSDAVKAHFTDFDLYRAQAECPLDQKTCLKTFHGQVGRAAWALDKYKFLHILQRTWEMRPNQSWYLFGEADTYFVWPNLVHWLRDRPPVSDPLVEPAYIGSAAMLAGIPFAHGGSGYLLSGALVRDLVGADTESSRNLPNVYDIKARGHCCGDQMLAKAILERLRVKVQHVHPMFNGEKPATFPYGHTHWCDPVLSMHHMEPEDISALWQYEQTRLDNSTILMKDLYYAFIANKMINYRAHWDNLSDDVCYIDPDPAIFNHLDDKMKRRQKKRSDLNRIEKEAHKSVAHCAKVCEYEGLPVDPVENEAENPDIWTQQHGLHGDQDANSAPRNNPTEGEAAGASGSPSLVNSNDPGAQQKGTLEPRDSIEPPRPRIHPLDRKCFQYRYHKGVCCTSRSFKLGVPRRDAKAHLPDKLEDVWQSGWHLQGISDWIAAKGECREPKWKVPDKL
ncbi:hypothetical protein SODALDRAFT_322382 [Sodiomyces alkalinus F11]|uniref:Glycosyltransferase family 31 protein n=1 Tax=Sodiomyces alkalinus (strain CBS 110278 / VKM F-3762 / F11) TaxID=1314773 RepID=A0A3N2Q353_SODAK|nr:hypothetical protein SODALDRAFT_322382 [Sodiomyces alkalinus F11]ROT41193.1 hypothetical protein SODALDRAFT_322382 [Sodiomyces alkalinus F11]